MSERDKKLLIYLGSLIVLAAAYFLVGKPYLDKYDELTTEKTELENELRQKQDAYNNRQKFEDGIIEANEKIQEIMDEFPEDNSDEKAIMFASHAETDIPIWFTQVKFAEETKMLINGEEVESASDVEAANEQAAVDAAEGESSSEESSDNSSGVDATVAGGFTGTEGLIWRNTELGLSFQTQYDGFKKYLAYIRDYEDRLVIKEIDATYNPETDIVAGTMILSQYAILGDDRVLPDVVTGVENFGTRNVFLNENHGGSLLDLLADMAADFLNVLMGGLGEEALDEFGTDYFLKLNVVTDNSNGKTIGRGDDVQGNTYITSDKNSTEDVSFTVSGEGGHYEVKYSIGKTSYVDTIEKDEESKIYLRIVSSERYSNDDSVAASIHITNKADIPVYINVEGDDTNKPRVNIVEKNGTVTVK